MGILKIQKVLSEGTVDPDPIIQFHQWYQEAIRASVLEPDAMILATVSPAGEPSARAVLLKGVDKDGFRFYTNHLSRKGIHLFQNASVALVFLWHELNRQVRIEGTASKLSYEDSTIYFYQRPRGSQLSASISPQSRVIPNREHIESLKSSRAEALSGKPVPMPEQWGGYLVKPSLFEFWQGRDDRLHDRLQYRKIDERWIIERLAP